MLGYRGRCRGHLPALRPAARHARHPASRPAAAMRAAGADSPPGRERFGLRRVLVTGQVALSLVLLVGALLFVRSLQKLLGVDAGFRPEGIVALDLDFSRAPWKSRLDNLRIDVALVVGLVEHHWQEWPSSRFGLRRAAPERRREAVRLAGIGAADD